MVHAKTEKLIYNGKKNGKKKIKEEGNKYLPPLLIDY